MRGFGGKHKEMSAEGYAVRMNTDKVKGAIGYQAFSSQQTFKVLVRKQREVPGDPASFYFRPTAT